MTESIFLTATWRDLAMLNYEVDPALLLPRVPPGTELDSHAGKTWLSLVGFRFLDTRLSGKLPIPFHAAFDEINLRFYVRRREGAEIRRGVVFLAEIVPKRAVAAIARWVYGENYVRYPMRHRLADSPTKSAEYSWRMPGGWCRLRAAAQGAPAQPAEASLEQFIAEHYWGYTLRPGKPSLEYRVAHPPWNVWSCPEASFEGDPSVLYGPELARVIQRRPDCAFIADGSPVEVYRGREIA